MRCVVTGASGFLGSYVARALLERGLEVAVLLRGKGVPARLAGFSNQLHIIRGDLTDYDSYKDGFLDYNPAAVLHLAWIGVANSARNDLTQPDNIPATVRLADLAAKSGVKHFINAGSQAEYGPLNKRISETDVTEPTTLYGHSKLAACHMAQQVCAQHDVRFAHLRVFSTYGPDNQPYWLIPYMITELLAGRSPGLTKCEQKWDFIYVMDAAEAFVETLLAPKAEGVFNLGSGTAPPLKQTAEYIRGMINPSITLDYGKVPYRPDQVMHLEADITRLKNATGWKPHVTLKEGIEQTVAWYAGNRLVKHG